MVYGDNEGAKAWRVGEENRGLAAMFVMMNAARLAVGTQGVAIGERAYQQALSYARERRQGRGMNGGDGMSPIIEHADVQRMLMTMKANVQAARGICCLTGVSLDLAEHAHAAGERTAAANRAALLTPIAKAFSTDIGDEATSVGVQVHGGMGFIEETGAAQHMRDSRIAAIYEGANGIHGIDLVQRKLPLANGETVRAEIAGIRRVASDVAGRGGAGFGATAERLAEASDALEESTRLMLDWAAADPYSALAGASPYLRLFGLTLGGACLAKAGLAAEALAEGGDRGELGRVGLARFFAEKLAVAAPGLARAIASGGAPLESYETILAGQRMTQDVEVGREGAVMWAAFARPQKKNAITGAMYEALIEAFEAAERDPSVGAFVLSGKGGVFTAGNDLGDFLAVASRPAGDLPCVAIHQQARRVRKAACRGGGRPRGRRRNDASLSLRPRLRHARVALPDAVREPWPRAGGRIVASGAATLRARKSGGIPPACRAFRRQGGARARPRQRPRASGRAYRARDEQGGGARGQASRGSARDAAPHARRPASTEGAHGRRKSRLRRRAQVRRSPRRLRGFPHRGAEVGAVRSARARCQSGK